MAKFKPIAPKQYQGNQIIINSDRLLFNAKEDSILLFAREAMSFSTNGSIHFDCGPNMAPDPYDPTKDIPNANSEFIVNAHKIILGFKNGAGSGGARGDNKGETGEEDQPALLGRETTIWLKELLDAIDALVGCLKSSANMTSKGDVIDIGLSTMLTSNVEKAYLDHLREQLNKKAIHSKRIYIQ
tara:strand:+ start:1296 stop:1850 length:555 start_codon:yes stop_codon:yes gene_type:complete